MNREIKFKAQKLNSDKFVIGFYFGCSEENSYVHYIFTQDNGAQEIQFNTLRQFTNLKCNYGYDIYDGDNAIKLTIIGVGEGLANVVMKDGMWQVYEPSNGYSPLFELLNSSSIKIESNNK